MPEWIVDLLVRLLNWNARRKARIAWRHKLNRSWRKIRPSYVVYGNGKVHPAVPRYSDGNVINTSIPRQMFPQEQPPEPEIIASSIDDPEVTWKAWDERTG